MPINYEESPRLLEKRKAVDLDNLLCQLIIVDLKLIDYVTSDPRLARLSQNLAGVDLCI